MFKRFLKMKMKVEFSWVLCGWVAIFIEGNVFVLTCVIFLKALVYPQLAPMSHSNKKSASIA